MLLLNDDKRCKTPPRQLLKEQNGKGSKQCLSDDMVVFIAKEMSSKLTCFSEACFSVGCYLLTGVWDMYGTQIYDTQPWNLSERM